MSRIGKSNRRQGTSLIEVLVSTLLVGVVLYTSLSASATIHSAHQELDDRIVLEAEALRFLEELRGLAYEEPDVAADASRILGRDISEAPTDRTTWDDVDDAMAYNVASLTQRNGQALASGLTCSCAVDVTWVEPGTLMPIASESGLKQVTIQVRGMSGNQAVVTGLFSRHQPNAVRWSAGYEITIGYLDGKKTRIVSSPRNRFEGPQAFVP